MTDLIAKLEAATAGSRMLDEEIWLACVPGATCVVSTVNHPKGAYELREQRDASRRLIIVPSYTASLDDALTLIPEGWMLASLGQLWEKVPKVAPWNVYLVPHKWTDEAPEVQVTAATAPITICIASLRARAAAKGE